MIITKEMVISGFISKIVNEIVDVPLSPIKNAIKNADKNRKDKNQSIETRIYQVTIDAINEFTKDKYKEQDVLYDAAESIVKGFKSSKNSNPEAVRAGLKMLVSQVTTDICEDFLGTLCYEICKEENRDLAIVGIISRQGQMAKDMHEGFENNSRDHEETHKCLTYAIESIDSMREDMNRQRGDKEEHHERPRRNKVQDYADKWDENVFLNNFDEEDEIVGVNIKLRDLYKEMCLPHYIWKRNTKPSENTLRELLEKYIMDNKNGEMLLILGQPGIGKSTLITWIVAELVNQKKDIFVYQFATDLKDTNWRGENILEEIIKSLRLKNEELKNKILILDGFDEIHTSSGREKILNRLSKEINGKKSLGRFSLIITCRENYVNCSCLSVEHYITLQAWNEEQIKNFCDIYVENSLGENISIENNIFSEKRLNKLLENKEIFGIPLILYMVLALNIIIEESDCIVDIYDQIFSLEGGAIYDRCYDMEHRINSPKIKKHIHRISQKIAFWIFENEEDEAVISQKNFEEICEYEMNDSKRKGEEIESDTLIGNFFKLKYSEGKGTDEIQFVHRSIYEYFVVVYFFESIHRLKSKEETAGKLGELLKDGCLSEQILEFIKCKFDGMKGYNLADVTREVFNIMLRNGMTYYTKEGLYSNVIEREINIFSNMLEVVGLWNPSLGELDERIIIYLQCNRGWQLNLSGIQLGCTNVGNEMVDLRRVNLSEANLSRAFLSGVNLSRAELVGANLSRGNLIGTGLSRADLSGANLSEVDLSGADLSRANLIGANLSGANLSGANLSGANLSEVDLSGAGLSKAELSKTDLSEANLIETDLSKTNLSGANLSRAKLKGAVLSGADLSGAKLIGANLSGVKLMGADLLKVDLIKTDLSGADLSGANLSRADLSRANLSRADLSRTNLSRADLSGANLNGADLSEANLDGVNLNGADLSGVNLDGTDLSCVILNEEQVIMLYRKYDISKSMVLLSEEDEIISIQKYYKYYIRERIGEIDY